MRIVLDARTVGQEFSGVGNYVLELVRGFSRLNEDHEFLLGVWGDSPLAQLDLDQRFRFFPIPFSHENHPLGDLWEEFVLPRRARREQVDVLHGPAFLIPTVRHDVATVVTIHDLVAFSHAETIPWKYAAYMRRLIRRAAHAATRVITDSESVRRDIRKRFHIPADRLDCIPLGVPSRFRPAPTEDIRRVRERYAIPRDYLLFVGNLEPRKNLPGLVRAYRTIREQSDREVDLVVAGRIAWKSGPLLRELGAEDLRGNVHTTGFVDAGDLVALYSGAEAFMFPSFWEGFGLPVLEAMACGTPVIASDLASIPEVAGDAAQLISPDSPDAIAEAALRLLRDPAVHADYVQRGLARAREFPWERTAVKTLQVYAAARGSQR